MRVADASGDARLEFLALSYLAEADGPVGSLRLAEMLQGAGIEVSEATAGRYLRRLDRARLSQTVGTRGRVLTTHGHQRLLALANQNRLDHHSSRVAEAFDARDLDEIMDLLHLRRSVEAETAGLASVRGTTAELQELYTAAQLQLQHATEDQSRVPLSLDFHRAVAHASHSRILSTVMALLLDPANDRLHRIHDEIMFFNQASDAPAPSPHDLAVDHVRVAEAIRRRDTRAAEMAMRKHCDKLIAAGEAYRSQTDGTSLSSFEPTVTGQIGTPRVRPM